jgi:hypothetical protein
MNPMAKRRFVGNPAELRRSITEFASALPHIGTASPIAQRDIKEFMRRSRAIYAVPTNAGFAVCGGKFCGHSGLTIEAYSQERTSLNGGHAHAHIRGWADEVGNDHPAHNAWESLCAAHGVQPASNYQTFLVRNDSANEGAAMSPQEEKVVDLIVQLTALLSPASRNNLKRRVAAI